ncbi:MAG: hypothetical protein K2K28_00045, partial [Clostridia bacterium]|nr:hypothetical protein [Clostridia bacterium]
CLSVEFFNNNLQRFIGIGPEKQVVNTSCLQNDFVSCFACVLFSVIKDACSGKTVKAVPQSLPVYFVAGADDPVGDYGKGVQKAYDKFLKAGVKDVNITLYENSRHEILNDDCREKVQEDFLAFINAHMTKPSEVKEEPKTSEAENEQPSEDAAAENA